VLLPPQEVGERALMQIQALLQIGFNCFPFDLTAITTSVSGQINEEFVDDPKSIILRLFTYGVI